MKKHHYYDLNRDIFSWIAIFVVLVGEILALIGLRTADWMIWGPWTGVSVLIALAMWFIGRYAKHRFNVKSLILTKLLANAITPRPLGVIYLLLFVIHIGWLTNAAMSLFTPADCLEHVIIAIAVCIIGMFILICFFPEVNIPKNDDAVKVFVTGISFIGSAPVVYDKLNLIPLVRILQLVEESDSACKLIILLTDAFKNGNPKTDAALYNVMKLVNEQKCSEMEAEKPIKQRLELLIREVAEREFKNKPWLNSRFTIEFTAPCNYNGKFESCFKELAPLVTQMDDENHQLYFNCTPGTSTIGALMTLLAIDGDRKLYYYSQEEMPPEMSEDEKAIFKENLLNVVDKTKIPLYSLLSQALEKFEKRM